MSQEPATLQWEVYIFIRTIPVWILAGRDFAGGLFYNAPHDRWSPLNLNRDV